jgi:hypothetical protein
MVKRKEIRVSIGKNGEITLEPVGATGQECMGWTKALEEAIGEVASREMKPEFYESQDTFETTNDDGAGT